MPQSDLWSLIWGKSEIDPSSLAKAIETELSSGASAPAENAPDFRTRVLIRDCTNLLREYWGNERLTKWIHSSSARAKLESIQNEELGETGFHLRKDQLVDSTQPETVREFLRELGIRADRPSKLEIGGSIALILGGYISRATADIDIADEVPVELRNQRELLDELAHRYNLILTHFQSHYLPEGWRDRLHDGGTFGSIQVLLVDVYDIFLGKLFSQRHKDLDDLRAIKPNLEQDELSNRLRTTCSALLREEELKRVAEQNWYILFGSTLPRLTRDGD